MLRSAKRLKNHHLTQSKITAKFTDGVNILKQTISQFSIQTSADIIPGCLPKYCAFSAQYYIANKIP